MKMHYLKTVFTGLILSTSCVIHIANAGVIKSSTGTNITQRTCPSVNANFSAYKAKWGSTILEHYAGYLPGNATTINEITPEAACIFNTQWEQYFPDAEPGSKISLQHVENNLDNAYLASADDEIWLDAVLDNSGLSLPEAHLVVTSAESERNSANLFSAQSYLWAGETTTLEFSAMFDFSMSTGTWGDGLDSLYGLRIGASQNLVLAEELLFPELWGDPLAQGAYHSSDDTDITDENINFRQLTIAFEVSDGDEFKLWAQTQAFALNGGWIDSANTMTTQLNVQGLSQEQSKQILASSLVVDVPEPSNLALFALGIIGLAARRFNH